MALDFGQLQLRLIRHLQERVRGGEISERSLARVVNVSQPHLHNVLKGKHAFSVVTADKILHHLKLDVLDLIEPEEWRR